MNLHKSIKKIPFTKAAFEKFKVDVELLEKEREEVLIRLQSAREMGDLSENGAYKYAKFELGNVNRKLKELRYKIRFGEVVEPSGTAVVDFGVTVALEGDRGRVEYQIVSSYEANPSQGKISSDSPLGQQLMNKGVGEVVTLPNGEKLTIAVIK